MELSGIKLNTSIVEIIESRKTGVARQPADHGSVLWRNIVEEIRRSQPLGANHVLNDYIRLAGDVARHVLGQQPRILIIAAADRCGGDEADLLAAIEFRDRLCSSLCRRNKDETRQHRGYR